MPAGEDGHAMDAPRARRMPDGALIAYRIWQPGPPRPVLVLLHGVGSNMTRWSELVGATSLRTSWDLLRVDLRGHGLSVYRGRLDTARWCADLSTILAAEGYPRAVVAGHCLGANIAAEFARRHPAQAAGLVLIEPMLRQALTGTMLRLARLRPLFVPATWALLALNALGIHRRRLAALDLEHLDRATRAASAAPGGAGPLLKRYASPWADLQTTPSLVYLQGLMAVSDPLGRLSDIRLPVLALLATGSRFSDPAVAEAALAAIPRVEIVRLPARHWIPTEQPAAMRQAIERWCAARLAEERDA